MIGVALAFLAPWGIALAAAIARIEEHRPRARGPSGHSVRFLVCGAAECNSAERKDLEVCVPLLVAGPSCSKHPSIVK
jgi:hypothetical protein